MESVHEKIHQIFYDIDQRDEQRITAHFEQVTDEQRVTSHFEQLTEEFMTSIDSFYDEFSELRFEIPKISQFPNQRYPNFPAKNNGCTWKTL